jgi:hypothetical protein
MSGMPAGSAPFFPSLGTLPLLDGVIQMGRGIAAAVIGQTYDVRRLTQPIPATGSISSQIPVWTNFPARLRRITSKLAIEDDIWGLICFEATCDNRQLQLLDELTETGYEAMTNGCYIYAQARPTRETLWMRAESNIAITRMMPTAGAAAQQPSAGWVADTVGLGTVQKDTEHVLTLNNGVYAFSGAGASPASIQCGLQPTTKLTDTSKSSAAGSWPTALYREKFLAYIPLLPGEQLVELDRLNFPNSDRYEIGTIYTSETTGIAGYLLILEKLGV